MFRVATTELVAEFPSKFAEFRLTSGRHRIALVGDKPNTIHPELTLAGKKIIERDQVTIRLPGDALSGYIQPVPPKPELIFRALGSVRLQADEEYDAVKHRFGLQVWIVP
ncbi:MAG: hypothetical protein SFV81_14125 [Pirellulaceae bacterium]|nr:hypothetical protein [Pirellulaceae bacterium]